MIYDSLVNIASGIPWTIALTVAAFVTGAILGLPLCMMLRSRHATIRLPAAFAVLILRSVPPLVWLFFIFFGIGGGLLAISPFQAAWIGLGLITTANLAEIYRGAFTAIHQGQREAAAALNLPAHSRFLDVLGPQLFRIAVPSAATFAISLLKDTAIASTIGVHEVAFNAYHLSQQTFRSLDIFAAAGLIYILVSLPMAWFANWADRSMMRSIVR